MVALETMKEYRSARVKTIQGGQKKAVHVRIPKQNFTDELLILASLPLAQNHNHLFRRHRGITVAHMFTHTSKAPHTQSHNHLLRRHRGITVANMSTHTNKAPQK